MKFNRRLPTQKSLTNCSVCILSEHFALLFKKVLDMDSTAISSVETLGFLLIASVGYIKDK
jgi:hypothetical protein